MERKYRVIDLFAGTGALSQTFHSINKDKYQTVFANDFDINSEKIYKINFPEVNFVKDDLNDIGNDKIPEHDILCGGFPCQPFSIAGEKKGFDDERSNVFWKICKILKDKNPDIVILENVKNLKTHDNGKTYKTIEKNLKDNGYYVKSAILDTSKITKIPQHRERIYIVCFKNEELYKKFDFNFNVIENKNIIDFLQDEIPEKYYYTEKLKIYEEVKKSIKEHIKKNIIYQYRRSFVRENKSKCCPTLTANMGSGGHNVPLLLDDKGIRKLTPRECFNLQGFPKNYKLPNISDSALYKLAGNSVTLPVVELIIKKIDTLI
jgi:DNA (cytosine-5)-methyltransferase 1